MALKESILNLNTALRCTLQNVPSVVDTLIRGLDGVAENIGTEDFSEERKVGKLGTEDIYEKVINIGTLPNTAQQNYQHNIANIDKITYISGSAYNPTGTTISLPYAYPEAEVVIYADRTYISVRAFSDRTTFAGIIKLQYTKTSASRSPEENDTKNVIEDEITLDPAPVEDLKK